MKQGKSFIAGGTILLTLAALALTAFAWQHWLDGQEPTAASEQTRTLPETASETAPPGPTMPLMDFSALLAQNPDVIGRIVIEGIGLDYPIVQGKDNSYYLTHTAERKPDERGALFLDYRINGDFSDFKSIIYGHHKSNGEMFGKLKHLRRQETFDEVAEGVLYTPERTYRLEIFASALTLATSEFYHFVFLTPGSREEHLAALLEQLVCYRDLGVTAEDRLLVLSTCSYEFKNARTVILARIAE